MQKISHFDDFRYNASILPGPGQYNPHNVVKIFNLL